MRTAATCTGCALCALEFETALFRDGKRAATIQIIQYYTPAMIQIMNENTPAMIQL